MISYGCKTNLSLTRRIWEPGLYVSKSSKDVILIYTCRFEFETCDIDSRFNSVSISKYEHLKAIYVSKRLYDEAAAFVLVGNFAIQS